jgi:hypothetical protein
MVQELIKKRVINCVNKNKMLITHFGKRKYVDLQLERLREHYEESDTHLCPEEIKRFKAVYNECVIEVFNQT